MTSHPASTSSSTLTTARSRWLVLATVGLAQFMVMLDATVVNVAIPDLRVELQASTAQLQWVVDAYVLVFGSLLLLGGRSTDLFGRRRVFLVGLAVFVVASFVCGIAPSATALIAARAVQGLGAALLSPAALSIIVSSFTDPGERRTAMTLWSALAAVGGTVGVVSGGALIAWSTWRWAFWINLPVGMITAILTVVCVPPLRAYRQAQRRFDALGGVLAVSGLAGVIFGLIAVSTHGWLSARTLGGVAGGLLLLALFGLVQRRRADPLLPVHLLTRGPLLLSSLGLLLIAAVMMSSFFMLSVYQQRVLGYTAFQAGLGVAALGAATLVIFPAVPTLMARIGPARVYLLGAVLVLVGVVLLAWLPTPDSSFATGLLPGLLPLGLGIPCCFAPLNALGVSAVTPVESGAASGVLTTFNQTGAALGMATVVTLSATWTADLVDAGHPLPESLTAGFARGYLALAGAAIVKIVIAVILNARSTASRE